MSSASETIVIEELLQGEETSVLCFSDGTNISVMPPAQDHKRLLDNDEGPNTGGMGAYCKCPQVSDDTLKFIEKNILQKAVDGMRAEGHPYIGVLYAGLMMTKDGPKVLEFNCRFGDPETQVIFFLLLSLFFKYASVMFNFYLLYSFKFIQKHFHWCCVVLKLVNLKCLKIFQIGGEIR